MSNAIDFDDTLDTDLAKRLREWRHEQARTLSVPPYWIFTNATLAAIAARRPGTLDDLIAIPGMGKTRAEKYGVEILALVAESAGRPLVAPMSPHQLPPSRLRPCRLHYPLPADQQEAFLAACGLPRDEVSEMTVEVVMKP